MWLEKIESTIFISDFSQINLEHFLGNDKNDAITVKNWYLLDSNALFKILTKRNWNFSPSHGLRKVCKLLLKRKSLFTQNLFSVKTITKNYSNHSFTLLKNAKDKYLTNFFNENIRDIKKSWKGTKYLVSMN